MSLLTYSKQELIDRIHDATQEALAKHDDTAQVIAFGETGGPPLLTMLGGSGMLFRPLFIALGRSVLVIVPSKKYGVKVAGPALVAERKAVHVVKVRRGNFWTRMWLDIEGKVVVVNVNRQWRDEVDQMLSWLPQRRESDGFSQHSG